MKRWLGAMALFALVLLPALAQANPPPPQQGGSPEPVSALLLLAGAGPAWLVYRRVRGR